MYAKILKESASQLTLLAIQNDAESRLSMEKNLALSFKQVTYMSNMQEALWLYKSEKFDVVLIDIDTLEGDIHEFIDDIKKQDPFQAIAVCSNRNHDAPLLIKLMNSHITGFIMKPMELNELCKILSKVCAKIQDRQMLLHYLEDMERLHDKVLHSCHSCSVKVALLNDAVDKFHLHASPVESTEEKEEEDDFEFFETSSATASSVTEDTSIYKDYFSFLDHDDKEELHDQLSDIDVSLLNAFSERGGDAQHIDKLGSCMMRYGNVLLHYQFFSDMGTSILEFGKTISDESEMIVSRSEDFQALLSGFCSGLQTYMSEVWEKSSENPKFFNDSIINDAETIRGMMLPSKATDSDDDLVFF
ncbi:MAG: response regulator [Sulfuricurvum sp.]|jgi:CheY-like chemotaxis protein